MYRDRSIHASARGQAATETLLTMSFLLLLIFSTVQITWWSSFKYLANLGAFGAMRTAMVGGNAADQMTAARQNINSRRRRVPGAPEMDTSGPLLTPMTRTIGPVGNTGVSTTGGRGGLGSITGGLVRGLTGGLLNGLENVFDRIPGLLTPGTNSGGGGGAGSEGGGGSGGGGGLAPGSSSRGMLGGLVRGLGGLVNTTFGSVLGGLPNLGGVLSGLFSSGSQGRTRLGLGYTINTDGGLPIQDGVRLVGWSHVTQQPSIPETGDNAGGFSGGFAGFTWPTAGAGGLSQMLQGITGQLTNLADRLLQQVQQPPPSIR